MGFDTTFFDGGVAIDNFFDEQHASIQPTPFLPLEKGCTLPLPLPALEVSNGSDSNSIASALAITTIWGDGGNGSYCSQRALGSIELGLP